MRTTERLTARKYLQPMREGGSLPGVVETDDGMFLVKFRGAGQGPRVLVAELIVAGVARALGLTVPDVEPIILESGFGAEQPDPEVRELLERSVGVNVGLRYLDGAFNYQPGAAGEFIDAQFASRTVWLDAFVTNPDRTARNSNLLIWDRKPWLIDHGSALYAHHAWTSLTDDRMRAAFPLIKDHVLLLKATDIDAADSYAVQALDRSALTEILDSVPDELFDEADATPVVLRARYVDWLTRRMESPRVFAQDAIDARDRRVNAKPARLEARR